MVLKNALKSRGCLGGFFKDIDETVGKMQDGISATKRLIGIGGDETGRNMAYQSYKKIESSVIDAYELLANPEDQELFFDYLTANLKLYFKKFEEELAPSVEEPTNQAYDMAVSQQDAAGEEDLELEL